MERTGRRRRFTLTGPSARLDPTTHAVRRDLADVRLADRVFAPHYAAPSPRTLVRNAMLQSTPQDEGSSIAGLAVGDPFELLELAGDRAWGVAPVQGLVGYLDADAIGPE